ncbi:trigger factor [Pararhodobacter zhoushanensis]|uniref:Trigger factor n=1 Tax=Pararhodobacter zhoushanensis TaxID=2479545 RepID=A0ABT3GYJ5_9RHOB|nr:trigger factor [Pararhodobacter zhoushanensis]MCW1932592.1 trigger factor [Pararhodobacter zhoushanensis]
MQVTETLNDGLKRGYTITVTAAELTAKVDEKLREAQPEVEIKGFRKGKVPMAMLKKQFGQRLIGEAMQEAVDGAMQQHFEETGARPAMQPKVEMKDGETWKEGDDVIVDLSYEALPEIADPDFTGVTLERLVVKADDAAVDEALANLAKQAQNFEDKDGAAENGDQVVFDFTGRIDGEAFDGGTAQDYPLALGSGQFIPGFEEQLVGVKAGETKDVTVSFPAEYQAAHLAGKEAVFECVIKAVKAPAEAELNDELASRFGAESLDALKGQIRDGLEGEYAQASRAIVKRALLDQLDTAVSFDLPQSLVDAEASQIAHQLWHDENPEVDHHNHDTVEPTDEHKSLAVRRVKLGLLLAEVGRKAEVQVTDAEMTQAIMGQARQYPGQEREFFEFVQKNQQMQQQLRAPIFEDKVVDLILGKAAVTEKEVTKDELKAALDALENEA